MKNIECLKIIIVLAVTNISNSLFSQQLDGFNTIKLIPTTEVKNQGYSGTCWSFATISFLETEALRKGKGTLDLSEMFIARYSYPEKAKNYFRTQGNSYFTSGGQTQDVMRVMKKYGLLPESAYKQFYDNKYGYNTSELDTAVYNYVHTLRKKEDDIIPLNWSIQFDSILNYYLGKPPLEFVYNNKQYTPKSFCSEALELNPDDYIQITSYNHHPFQQYFCLESRFNWSYDLYYNVELSSFMNIINKALMKGYSVVFNGDVSESSFNYNNGTATLLTTQVDQWKRQDMFESGSTTVDHVMHIVGLAKGKDGKKYYITKNSWGTRNKCSGYIYLSEDFIKLKAVSILVNKDALKN